MPRKRTTKFSTTQNESNKRCLRSPLCKTQTVVKEIKEDK